MRLDITGQQRLKRLARKHKAIEKCFADTKVEFDANHLSAKLDFKPHQSAGKGIYKVRLLNKKGWRVFLRTVDNVEFYAYNIVDHDSLDK